MSRRPEPLSPSTSVSEWDASGQRVVRALIALLTSNFGGGVSGMARFWAGRIAVTEHIPGLSAYESHTHARGRRKGPADPGVASGWAARLEHGNEGIAWSLHAGFGASGAVCPSGSGAAAPGGALCVIDPCDAAALSGGPAVRVAFGGRLSLTWLSLRAWSCAQGLDVAHTMI
jgi:hypothetical protein